MTLLIKGQKQIRNGYYTRERIGHSPTWVSGAARYRDNPSSISSITLSSQPLLLRGSRDFESQPIMRGFFERSSPLGIAAKLQENLDRLGVPRTRLEDFRALRVVVNRFSMIRVGPKVYSVSSWLIRRDSGGTSLFQTTQGAVCRRSDGDHRPTAGSGVSRY